MKPRAVATWVSVAVVVSATALLFDGCAAKRQIVADESGLTADMLRAEGVALVGVVVMDEVEQIRPPLVEAMESSLLYWRPDIAVTSAGRVRDQLGPQSYRRMLRGFQQSGSLTEFDRAELSTALRNVARYLILARVEQDAVKVRGRGSFSSSNRSGTIGSIGVGVSSRNARVRVILYDTSVGRAIRTAVYTGSSDFIPPAGMVPVPTRPEVLLRQRQAYEPDPDPAPHLPTLVDALLEAFRGFALDLPGPLLPPLDAPDSSATRGFRVTPTPLTIPER